MANQDLAPSVRPGAGVETEGKAEKIPLEGFTFEYHRYVIDRGFRLAGSDAPAVRLGDPHADPEKRKEAQIAFDEEYEKRPITPDWLEADFEREFRLRLRLPFSGDLREPYEQTLHHFIEKSKYFPVHSSWKKVFPGVFKGWG